MYSRLSAFYSLSFNSMSDKKAVSTMKKDELLNEIEALAPDFDTDKLSNNDERREKLSELREQGSDEAPQEHATAEEIAEENGYPMVNSQYVIEVLVDGKETATHHHCKLADGGTVHVSKDKFN